MGGECLAFAFLIKLHTSASMGKSISNASTDAENGMLVVVFNTVPSLRKVSINVTIIINHVTVSNGLLSKTLKILFRHFLQHKARMPASSSNMVVHIIMVNHSSLPTVAGVELCSGSSASAKV